ncbi:hypothetical protein [Shewanella sp. YLB-07]|uniref:hypothetical protein n=1 Tax=Shewanella sp. YLB-07 TaxID=2601268 RepID=UPI00128C69EF|nr:hypothetical protein [Shewanella sp. YLB-07]MPY23138.1 hypothetical protein [Shewanella sp. YLB-07]
MDTYRLWRTSCPNTSARRREHVHVGSAAASMLPKLAAASGLVNLQEGLTLFTTIPLSARMI